ncbi:MAG: ribonuclease G [Halioglobus sp.]
MAEEILINVSPMETRVAVIEQGVLQDVYIERTAARGIVGNIYVGKVVRVLPGMQAAFVDFGGERTGFLHASDIRGNEESGQGGQSIRELVHDGKKMIVQVAKDPLGSKGARLTTQLSLSSRYLVFQPQADRIAVSRRIEDPAERERLRQIVDEERVDNMGGFIVRTVAEGANQSELHADIRYLKRLGASVLAAGKAATRATLLHEDLSLALRAVRDFTGPGLERIWFDDAECFSRAQAFCNDYVPAVAAHLELYRGDQSLFDSYGVSEEIQCALDRKVELQSGGYLVIDQTEAMTTVDVNTGSFVGKKNLEGTIYQTNLEAAVVLARQLRIRNLGGIIIVDFIDMRNNKHRANVHKALETALQEDPVQTKMTAISPLGLIEMTRERSRESLERMLCEPCPVCDGRGVLKSVETICLEALREIMYGAPAFEGDNITVLAAQNVVDRLQSEESGNVADLAARLGKKITFRVEPGYSREHFDILRL